MSAVVHEQVAGWGGVPGECGARCACGTTFDGFDSLAEAVMLLDQHIADATGTASADLELSTADTVDAELIDETPDPQRAAWLGGMRELCDWLETHPEAPLPYLDTQAHNDGQGFVPALVAYIMPWDTPRETFATIARAMGRARKTVNDATGRFYLSRRFGGAVDYVASVPREEVCERVVVGTREVTEKVPDPEHVAAAPLVTRTRTVEEVTWRCTPVLAEALPAGGS